MILKCISNHYYFFWSVLVSKRYYASNWIYVLQILNWYDKMDSFKLTFHIAMSAKRLVTPRDATSTTLRPLCCVAELIVRWIWFFRSAISDSCVAMKEWVDNPQAETTLSNILPCDDETATNQTLYESRKVVSMLVNTVNTYIYTAANTDRPPSDQFYYNQSGPLIPPLCYPFDDKMKDHECSSQEVSLQNASTVRIFLSF